MVVYTFRCAQCRTEKAVWDVSEAHQLIAGGYVCEKCQAAIASEPLTGEQVKPAEPECATAPARKPLGYEMPHETQSGLNRLGSATGLILQMPQNHDGRATWLMNYAEHRDPKVQALIRTRPRAFASIAEAVKAAAYCNRTLSREEMIEYIETQHKAGYARYYNVPPSVLSSEALIVEWDSAAHWAGDQ